MCVPPAVLTAVTAIAGIVASRRQQRDTTPQISRNEVPASRLPIPAASGSLDPEKIKGEDETLTVGTTSKQKKDRKRVREGLKTLGAVDPASSSLPSSPDQGIST
tara:strand:+ start:566 stop:880 length:315 start_codon:yes stop_codon:yes gene_type:complete